MEFCSHNYQYLHLFVSIFFKVSISILKIWILILVLGLLPLLQPQTQPTCESHTVVSQTTNSVQCKLVLTNCNSKTFAQSKDSLCSQLLSQLKTNSKNTNCKITINSCSDLPGSKVAVNYTCNGILDIISAKQTLNNCFLNVNFIKNIFQFILSALSKFILSNLIYQFIHMHRSVQREQWWLRLKCNLFMWPIGCPCKMYLQQWIC